MKRKRIGFICAVIIPVILFCAAACEVKGVQDMKIIEDKKDIVIYHIPQNFECGSYSLSELKQTGEQYVDLTFQTYEDYTPGTGRLTYSGSRTFLLKRKDIDKNMKAVYSADGHIEKITIRNEDNNAEIPVYIFFSDTEAVKEAIKEPALKISESFSKQILSVEEPLSRVFLDYFYDGDCLEFYSIAITDEQRRAKEAEYPQYPDIADNSGDFYEYAFEKMDDECDYISTILSCVDDDEEQSELFYFAAEFIENEIKENVLDKISKTDDFKFISGEYD